MQDNPNTRRTRVAQHLYRYVSDGRFEARFRVDKIDYVVALAAENLTQAKAARDKAMTQARAGGLAEPTDKMAGEAADDFLRMFESLVLAGERAPRTLEIYSQHRRLYFAQFDNVLIQKFRVSHLSRMLEDLRERGLSPWTIAGVLKFATLVLEHAVAREWITENPTRRLSNRERPKPKKRVDARVLTVEEIATLLEHAPDNYRALLTTAVLTGLRQSELLGLCWRDVDLATGILHVRHQLSRASKARPAELVPLKTDAGARDVELRPAVVRALKAHKAARAGLALGFAQPDAYVFGTLEGTPLYYRNVSTRGLDKATEAAGLGHVTFHDLRRSFASHLIRSGIDPVRASGQIGHANPSVTLDIYARDFAEASRDDDIQRRLDARGFGV